MESGKEQDETLSQSMGRCESVWMAKEERAERTRANRFTEGFPDGIIDDLARTKCGSMRVGIDYRDGNEKVELHPDLQVARRMVDVESQEIGPAVHDFEQSADKFAA